MPMIRLLPPLPPEPLERCKHSVTRLSVARSENQGDGPRVRCKIETCVECSFSWIEEKRRLS